jgi:hypothetical protein
LGTLAVAALSYFNLRDCLLPKVSFALASPHFTSHSVLHDPASDITMENTNTDTLKQSATGFQALASLAHPMQTAVIAALILVICTYFPKLRYRAQLAKLPVFSESKGGKEFLNSAKEWYDEGYQKVRLASALGEYRSDISSSKTRPIAS